MEPRGDGTPVTDDMADQAERGYDVDEIRHRRGGLRPMGWMESDRVDPELRRELLLRAAQEKISVSGAISGPSASTCAPGDGRVRAGLVTATNVRCMSPAWVYRWVHRS